MVDQALVAARMSAARLRARRGDLSPIPSRAVRAIHLGRFVLCLWPCHRLGRCRRRMPGTLEQLSAVCMSPAAQPARHQRHRVRRIHATATVSTLRSGAAAGCLIVANRLPLHRL